MAMSKGKGKKRKVKQQAESSRVQTNIFANLKSWQQILIGIFVILIVTLFSLSDLVFNDMTPAGGDVISSKGKTNMLLEYEKKTGEESLWNPAIFCGMPMYHRYGPRSWSLDTFAGYFYSDNAGQVIAYHLIGAIGMFVLLYSLNFSLLISLFGALAFLLMPHYNSLWLAGHFSKFRAIMFMPWVIAGFIYFLSKKNLLSVLLFTLAISLQVRTQHYQIIFYTLLVLLALGIYQLIKLIAARNYADIGKSLVLLCLGVVLSILSVYQPLFVMKEYTPYSTRGGNPTNIVQKDNSAEKAQGVSFEYATKWSLSPKEMITFIIPRYFGGKTQERYTGDDVPQLKGRTIPGYWGDMPFTSSTDYIGVILFIFLVFGIYGYRKDWRIQSLIVFTVFALLLGFGRHFPFFYKIFFYNLPYFSKFRVPTMSMMAVFFVFVIFAAYGIRYLIESLKEKENKNLFTLLYLVGGFIAVLTLSPLLLKGSLDLSTAREAVQYDPQLLKLLKNARFELLMNDALRTLLFAALTIGVIFAALKKYIGRNFFLIAILVLMVIDVSLINKRFNDGLVPKGRIENMYFPKTSIDNYLLSSDEVSNEPFRILGLGQRFFGNNQLAYYHQCIGGYDAAKMQSIQDIVENNLYAGSDREQPLNWNVVNMLNGRYLVYDQILNQRNLRMVISDEKNKSYLFENMTYLPRAFLVGDYVVHQDPSDLLRHLNDADFNPRKIALLTKEIGTSIAPPDSVAISRMIKYTPNEITIEAATDNQCLLVLSEVYYPKGWKAYVDGKETEIFKTNHLLRSILLPEGEHRVSFEFHPSTYFRGKWIATISNLIVLFAVAGLLILRLKKSGK